MEKHLPILFSAVWALIFFAGLLSLSKLVRPDTRADSRARIKKNEQSVWIQISGRFQGLLSISFLFLLSMLVFYPVVTMFKQSIHDGFGFFSFLVLGVFLLIICVGLAYSWVKGDFLWVKDVERVEKFKR